MTTYQRLNDIRKPDIFTDTLSAAQIAGIESTAVDSEDFLTGVLSQINRMIGATDWHSAVADAASDPRTLKLLTDDVYYATRFRWRRVSADITVPAAQQYVVLSQASSETPGEVAAAGAGSANGAVVAVLGTDVGTAGLDEVAGVDTTFPKNLCLIREAGTDDPILSAGREVFALIQAETGVVDGDSFNDTDHQAQLSFVRRTSSGDDLELVPAGDIATKVINYQYQSRTQTYLLNEQDSIIPTFSDPTSAAANTLQQAYVGGNTISVSTGEGDLIVDLTDDLSEFEVRRNGAAFATFTRNDTTGDVITFDADDLDVNTTNAADFSAGIAAATATTTINLGVTAGQIDASTLTVASTTGDLNLDGNDDITFTTVRETTALPLDDATAGPISGLAGGPHASVSAAIAYAIASADLDIHVQTLTSNYAQDANVPGSGNGNAQDWVPALDLSSKSIDMNTPATVDTIILLNGRVLYGGNGTTNQDVYAGDTPANGDLKYDFPKGVKTGDWVMALSWAV